MLPALLVKLSCGILVAAALPCGPSSTPSSFSGPDSSLPPAAPRCPVEKSPLDGGSVVKLKHFEIKLPKGWERKRDLIVALHARPVGGRLYSNLRVAVVNLPEGVTMMDSVTQSKKVWAKTWAIEKEEAVKVNGASAYRMVLMEDLGLTKSKQVKYFIAAKDKVLIVSGASAPEEFGKQLPLFEAVVKSLKILTP